MRLPDGIKAVETLEQAGRLLRQFAMSSPGDYFIFDTRQEQVIAACIDRAVFAVLPIDLYTQLQNATLTQNNGDNFRERLRGIALPRG
jgi:hypothetical protein